MATRDTDGLSSLLVESEADAQVRQELVHHVETLRDLGPEYNDAVAASLMHTIQPMIDERIRQVGGRDSGGPLANAHRERRKTLALILGFAIPLTLIAGNAGGLLAIGLVWVALFIIAIVVTTQ